MNTFIYEGKTFWHCTREAALRPHGKDRLEVINFKPDGSITCKTHTVTPGMYRTVTDVFEREMAQCRK